MQAGDERGDFLGFFSGGIRLRQFHDGIFVADENARLAGTLWCAQREIGRCTAIDMRSSRVVDAYFLALAP